MSAFVLRPSGWVSLDANGEIVYSVINIHDGAMPLFSPETVLRALNESYANGVKLALAYHETEAAKLINAAPFHSKWHSDSIDKIMELARG